MTRVTENLKRVRAAVETAAAVAGRDASSVRILAVSKRHPAAAVQRLAAAGQRDFGENFVNEALEKIAAVDDPTLCWHYIGAIQSNKTRDIATHFDWVHTVDRLKIAKRLSDQRADDLPALNVCLQVNIDREPQKAGVDTDDAAALAAQVAALPRLRLRGLMCLPKPRSDEAAQRAPFRALRELFERLRQTHTALDTLSMGMSADMAAAIAEGASIVRIGTALFGPRD